MKKLTLVAVVATLIGCASGANETYRAAEARSPSASTPRTAGGRAGSTLDRDLQRVRDATARFRDLEVARAEGWSDQYPEGCAESPDGAQAYHYLNRSLVNSSVDLLRPELLMYEPQDDGSMELVGVDYIIPFDQWTDDEPPTLLGRTFGRNEPLGVWAIHIWAWRNNPSGTFAPWNPTVSCAFAG